MTYKVGQIVKNKRTRVERRITKVSKGVINWIAKKGNKKGVCLSITLTKWINGNN